MLSKEDSPFFVVGSARSGTTMLMLMLNRHSRINIPPESWFLIDVLKSAPKQGVLTNEEKDKIIGLILNHWRWKDWKLADEMLLSKIQGLGNVSMAELLDVVYRLHDKNNKARWGDKTPGYGSEIKNLYEVFPNSKYIHIIRDARDVCVSLRNTGWAGDHTWPIATYWNNHVGEYCRQGRMLPTGHYMEINYEDLVRDTQKVINQVCIFLDERFEPQMLNFYEDAGSILPGDERRKHNLKAMRPPRPSDLERWRNELSNLHLIIFEAGAAKTMRLVGQKVQHPLLSVILCPAFQAIDWLAEFSLPVRKKIGLHFPWLRRQL